MKARNGIGVTVVGHDSEDRTLVSGYEGPGSYARNVTYDGISNLSQLKALTIVSNHCEQLIIYECHGSVLLNNSHPRGWLVSRDGAMMKYWGGVSSDEYKCECGVSGSCVSPKKGCHCDKNDFVLREDRGILSRKSDLPVSQLRFGDTGSSNEWGYHTLRRLWCYGEA